MEEGKVGDYNRRHLLGDVRMIPLCIRGDCMGVL